MRYLRIYRPAAPEGTPPTQEDMARMGNPIEEMTKAGVLLATGPGWARAPETKVRNLIWSLRSHPPILLYL